ncbi:MAG: right-handed parallel beta-helix repeat-containing protein [Candidatus Dependentiae bacterium]|nr:right-handed parallel beta-helix repeat-containing protein [Candidatus Dependentiae bacterium]
MKQLRSLRDLMPNYTRRLRLFLTGALLLQPAFFATASAAPTTKQKTIPSTQQKKNNDKLTAALEATITNPKLSDEDKQLIASLPKKIDAFLNANKSTTTLDLSTRDLSTLKTTLTTIKTNLTTLEKNAEATTAEHVHIVRLALEEALQVIDTINPADTREGGSYVDEANFQILWRLFEIVSVVIVNDATIISLLDVIESSLDACCATLNSKIDAIDFDSSTVISIVEVIESNLEQCCATLNSKIDAIDFDSSTVISIVEVIESNLEQCCATLNSKIDAIDFDSSTVISIVEVIESKLDACCATLNSKLDVIDDKDDTIISKVMVVESKLDGCCATLNSKLDVIESNVEVVESKLDGCCFTVNSKLDVLLACPPTPIFVDGVSGTVTLDTPGCYCLATNVCGQIIIAANDVHLDLNCRTLSALGGLSNIVIQPSHKNIAVYNGSIVGTCGVTTGDNGIDVQATNQAINLHDLLIEDVANNGINVGINNSGIIVRNVTIQNNPARITSINSGINVAAGTRNVTLETIVIQGCNGHGIHFTESSDLQITNALIQDIDFGNNNGGAAVFLDGSGVTSVTNVSLNNVRVMRSNFGIFLGFAANVCITESSIQNGVSAGVFSTGSALNVSLRDICIDSIQNDASSDGIHIEGTAQAWNINNATVKNCSGRGIFFDGTAGSITDMLIADAYVTHCSVEGITLNTCETITIKNSTVSSNGYTGGAAGGILLDTCFCCNLLDNKVNDNIGNPAHGISFENCQRSSIIRNCVECNHSDLDTNSVGILMVGINNVDSSILNNRITHNRSTNGAGTSYGIRNELAGDTVNQYLGNYACGHDFNYFNVDFIRDMANASPWNNVECDLIGSNIDDLIFSALENCCFTLNSKVDALNGALDNCCFTLNSKVDVLNGDLDNCCFTLNSKVDALNGDLDNCCLTLNSKVAALTADLDNCCITTNSRLGVIETNMNSQFAIVNSKLSALLDCLCSCTDCVC